jgi:acetyl-CoA C-acetyltransferase
LGQNPARQVALHAGLPKTVPCTTINKVCASSLKAISLGYQAIKSGSADVIVVGGTESMSQTPYYLKKQRWGSKYGHEEILDGILLDGLTDAYSKDQMGIAGDLCAAEHGISKEEQDNYSILSYERAQKASAKGLFNEEIVPVQLPGIKGAPGKVITEDEEPPKVFSKFFDPSS